ncbi:hypothetical protein [uncultured Tenacibaculum sp.]|uniref:hypothetical protein n=1 Tax=uncultured Tenacibaculum sp. TaxID=174713 RepID=UPI002638F5ED|nr:hypothetical protein [uncultured Tenacibaculum sp.]
MKKSILSLGKTLAKSEQKKVTGGKSLNKVFPGPCNEYCNSPKLQELYWQPLYCICTVIIGPGNGGGDDDSNPGPV